MAKSVAVPRDPGPTRPVRRAANVTLPEPLLREAKALGVSLSQACERGLTESVAEARAQAWLAENRAAIDAWNEYVEQNCVPLGEFRQF
ncbi:MAG TPA: type II toxin-antitoxin system CcdA family antitoxin [Acetobacteraceae bacterium]|nr:type II toxin-antitoxin system CcdA family antitoxin [Acetobacteraceae bacterium]